MKTNPTTDEAIERVKENNRRYYDDLLIFFYGWYQLQFKPFTSEDLKRDYYALGNEPPHEPRVFGAVFRKLSKEGFIFRHGIKFAENPICHSRPLTMWISLQFRLKQQSNRTKDKTNTQEKLF